MYFNSIDFAIFLPLVFFIYWFICDKNLKSQNILLVLASYVFYGWWDYRFLFLIVFSTIVDFLIGRKLKTVKDQSFRKAFLWVSIFVNIGLLGFFKYYNFFVINFVEAFSFFGGEISIKTLNIILPVGISFYTFQTMSYTIDVYKNKLKPTTDFISFAAFVSFFPQLVAGPIERATNLLPQFYKTKKFNYAQSVDGLRQILWGLFKKVVIADNAAIVVNEIFNNSDNLPGSALFIGALLFTFQIYGDFSGYSDMAIGTSKLFGFNLKQNFAFPYFARDIAEFWRKWHISLSTWFRDYLYIPLGGSKGSSWIKLRNTLIIFVVSGFWHGANWTFVLWGALNAIYFLPLILRGENKKYNNVVAKGKLLPSLKELMNMSITFFLTMIAWVIFRAENISHAFDYISTIFSKSLFEMPYFKLKAFSFEIFLIIIIFMLVEWIGREDKHALEKISNKTSKIVEVICYYIIVLMIFFYSGHQQDFIYFQF